MDDAKHVFHNQLTHANRYKPNPKTGVCQLTNPSPKKVSGPKTHSKTTTKKTTSTKKGTTKKKTTSSTSSCTPQIGT